MSWEELPKDVKYRFEIINIWTAIVDEGKE